MAINTPNWGIDPYTDFNFTYKDVAIGGKLVTGTIRMSEDKMMAVQSDHMLKQYLRTSMATQMGEYMISNGLVEFTQMRDSISFDTIVKARCYLAPNDQVKILRMHYADT
jgi:hypothetical protein